MFAIVNRGVRPMFYTNPWVNFFYDLNLKIQKEIIYSFMDYHLSIHDKNWEIFNQFVCRNLKKPAELRCLLSENYDCQSYEMTSEELKEYNMAQIDEIKKYKTFLEEKYQNEYQMNDVVVIWADKYSHSFRKYWHLKRFITI